MNSKNLFATVDTHTEGGPTRVITSGFPRIHGRTMGEKMAYFQSHHDDFRKLLMHEPRGHQGMFGAVLIEPTQPGADLGVLFLTHSGYLSMCVHSAIGAAAACLETGMISRPAENQPLNMETPAGMALLYPKYEGDRLDSVMIQTGPAFVFGDQVELNTGRPSPIRIGLAYSAVFFALADAEQLGITVAKENIPDLIQTGVEILEEANRSIEVKHPDNPAVKTIELALLYEEIGKNHARNAVVSRTGSLDRSPCGAGTGAKMAYLFAQNKLGLNETYTNEGVFGTKFTGKLVQQAEVGPYKGGMPQISGSAYITGIHRFLLDPFDPLDTGI